MKITNLCPGCLTELPDDYPFDHVSIDRTIAGDPQLFKAMGVEERREVIRAGRALGLSDTAIATRVNRITGDIRYIMGEPVGRADPARDEAVRALWNEGLSDGVIGMRVGMHPGSVAKVRHRLGLDALFGAGGRRKAVSA